MLSALTGFWRRLLGWVDPSAVRDSRVFLQRRVALYLQLLFFFLGAFYLIGAGTALASGIGLDGFVRSLPHLGLVALLFAGWRLTRAGRRPIRLLWAVESLGTVLICAFYARLILDKPGRDLGDGAVYFATALTLILRAAIVPSSGARTAAVSLLAFAPNAVALVALYRSEQLPIDHPYAGRFELSSAIYLFTLAWAGAFTAACAIVSRVIYGLQETVREQVRLGQYELEERIGEGGMGQVYRARHAMLRRPTAVKLLPPEKAGEKAIARFEREVRQTARLTHPNTVAVYDFGRTPEGVFYYAMELLDGLALDDLVELGGPLPPARVARVLRQVAGALGEAHDFGLIHRDIKPANVLLCRRGGAHDVAKVVDFGLVKELAGSPGLSTANVLAGTPLYMAPESVTAPDRVDARTDLYALGAVGWFLLVGRHVFDGKNVVEICGHHLHTAPEPPSAHAPGEVPEALDAIVLRCLEKDPAKRFASAAELEAELEAAALPSWGEAEARDWWERNAHAIATLKAKTAGTSPSRAMTVALGDRG